MGRLNLERFKVLNHSFQIAKIALSFLLLQPTVSRADEQLAAIALGDIQMLTSNFINTIEIDGCRVTIKVPLGKPFPPEIMLSSTSFDLSRVTQIDVRPRPNPQRTNEIILFQMEPDAAAEQKGLKPNDDQTAISATTKSTPVAIFTTKRILGFGKPINEAETQINDIILERLLQYQKLKCMGK